STTARDIGLGPARGYALRDLWEHRTTESAGGISATVPGHGTVMYRVAPTSTPGRYAPHLVLDTTAPGWTAGSSATVTATLTNHGTRAADGLQLGVATP